MFKIFCTLFLLYTSQSQALDIQPSKVVFTPEKLEHVLTLTNDQEDALNIDLSIHDFVMNNNARLELVDGFDGSLKPYISVSPTTVSLGLDESISVRVVLDGSVLSNKGDMHSHLTMDISYPNSGWGGMTTSQPLLFKQEGMVTKGDFKLNSVTTKDGKVLLQFTKLNELKHLSMWVEGYVEKQGKREKLFYPFFNKMYREVTDIVRQVNLLSKPDKGDVVEVFVYDSPKKVALLQSFKVQH